MTDIIEKARKATGEIDSHEITLKKETYQKTQRGAKSWKVAVYINGENISSSSTKDLEAQKAQELFEELISRHDLTQP